MYPVYKINEIKRELKTSFISREVVGTKMTRMLTAGDLNSSLRPQTASNQSKVLGILFANPEVPFVKNEILPSLDYFHHLTATHLDIFCGGFFAYVPPGECPDRKSVRVGDVPWEYSSKAQIELEDEIEKMSSWKRSGETTLLLIEVSNTSSGIEFKFDHSLDLNLEKMIKDGAISSVRNLVNSLTVILRNQPTTWSASDSFGVAILKNYLRSKILDLLPGTLKKSYEKAEHFAVKDYTKR